jgi:DNA-binding transcriptional MerR regulator
MRHHNPLSRIGALASASGVTADTVRYYEREGLLPPPIRTAGGFRLYGPDAEQRLKFVKQARAFGMSLREIRRLAQPENTRCSAIRALIAERVSEVDDRIRELREFRRTLQTALDRCNQTIERSKHARCPLAGQIGVASQPCAGRTSGAEHAI